MELSMKIPRYPLDLKEIEHTYLSATDKEWDKYYQTHMTSLVHKVDQHKHRLSLRMRSKRLLLEKQRQDALEKIYTIAETFPTVIYLPDNERKTLEKSPYETLQKILEDLSQNVREGLNSFGLSPGAKIRISAGKVQPMFVVSVITEDAHRLSEWRRLDSYLNSPLKF